MSSYDLDKECKRINITHVEEIIGLILDLVKHSLGIGLSNVLLYSLGKSIGQDLYDSYPHLKSGEASLEEANEHLINCLKTRKLVKDMLILKALRPDERLELVCRINTKEFDKLFREDQELKASFVYFFYRGILSRYYELFFNTSLRIKKISTCLSEDENTICEFVLVTPLEDRVDEP